MAKRIMIMAGGTGGHVYPALAVANLLREKNWQVSWMGTQKGLEARVVPDNNIDVDWMTVTGLRGKGTLAKLTAPFMVLKACLQALTILRKRNPDVVLGMGGFVAGPGGLMARFLGIPLVIHEQNRIPGTTNRILAKLATQVLEAFPASFVKEVKAICTGNPLREEIANLVHHEHPPQQRLRVLVVGGSLGAQVLNEIVPEAMVMIENVSVRHQTGEAMYEQVKKHYQQLGVAADVAVFIEDMEIAYLWADIIVCRSGAMTVSEIAAAGLPSILIPLPFAIDDHQVANANYLVEANAGIMIKQDKLNTEVLSKQIKELAVTPNAIVAMGVAARACAKLDATAAVANICIQEAKA